jgi:uncharacterized membrane protein YtjA (UPF0391 family)
MILEAIGSWPGAIWLRESATAYLFVNAAHILGIGLLLGSILPLDLRVLGFFRRFPLEVLRSFLVRNAAVGLTLAIVTGIWLFSVKPAEYLANTAFRWKMVFLVIALLNAAFQHRGESARAFELTRATRVRAVLSLCLWLSALLAGRWIGFL